MSIMLYGAAILTGPEPALRAAVAQYWQDIARLHGFYILQDSPPIGYLEPSIASRWEGIQWVRFGVTISLNEAAADGFLLAAAQAGGAVLGANREGLADTGAWVRVPQWRGLAAMLGHESVAGVELAVEHSSGDAADPTEALHMGLLDALADIWDGYVIGRYDEDARFYSTIQTSPAGEPRNAADPPMSAMTNARMRAPARPLDAKSPPAP